MSGAIDSPYRGLRAFREADAAFFFGRETAVADVLARPGCPLVPSRPAWSPDDSTLPPPLALSPDGHAMASGAGNGTVRLWNLRAASAAARRVATTIQVPPDVDGGNNSLTQGVQALAFSPDSRELAVAYVDGSVHVFSAVTGQPIGADILAGSVSDQVLALVFSPRPPGSPRQAAKLVTLDSAGAVSTRRSGCGAWATSRRVCP